MTTIEKSNISTLTEAQLDEVNGGIWGIVARIAMGVGMTILENQKHNGRDGTITMGELLQRHGL